MFAVLFLMLAGLCLLGLAAWVLILPPRDESGFESHDLRTNYPAETLGEGKGLVRAGSVVGSERGAGQSA